MTKETWLEKNGFNKDGVTYCICGENTYSIKDWLKGKGCKFNAILKWHISKEIELPEGYKMFSVSFDEVSEWNEEQGKALFYDTAKELMEKKYENAEGPSNSDFIGSIGERLRNITATYKGTSWCNTKYGISLIHTFEVDENKLVWFTMVNLELDNGQTVDLTGTVKNHKTYRGVKTTQIARCIIKPISG